jgi:hypothetical protein
MKVKDLIEILADFDPEMEIGIHDEVDDIVFREFEFTCIPCLEMSGKTAIPWFADEEKKLVDILVVHHPCLSSHFRERKSQ